MKGNLGETSSSVKLKEYDVLAIVADTNSLHKDLAKKYNVDRSAITSIKNGRNWSYLTGIKYVSKDRLLCADKVIEIYTSKECVKDISKKHNVSTSTVHCIRLGWNYASITGHKRL